MLGRRRLGARGRPIWSRLFARLGRNLGIDLGTANTLVHVEERGILLWEPSVVAIDRETADVLAVGADAKRMVGRTPGTRFMKSRSRTLFTPCRLAAVRVPRGWYLVLVQ